VAAKDRDEERRTGMRGEGLRGGGKDKKRDQDRNEEKRTDRSKIQRLGNKDKDEGKERK